MERVGSLNVVIRSRFLRAVASGALCCGIAACGATAPTPYPTARPTSTATPGPDVQRLDLVVGGMGTYQLTAIPVAVVRNVSTAHTATDITVHFAITAADGTVVQTVDTPVAALGPHKTMAFVGRADMDGTGDHADVSIAVGSWTKDPPPIQLTGSAVTYACGNCSDSAGYGTVTGTLTAETDVAAGTPVYIGSVCYDASGAIVGGGSSQAVWPSAGKTLNHPTGVIVNAPPTSCELYGAPGW